MVSPRREVDVLVIGLGPGGAAAANEAARAGVRVLAIDKKKRIGEPVQCAEFIPTPMRKYALAEGVLIQSVAAMNSYLPSGAVTQSDFPGLMVDRAAFDRALAAEAVRHGAELTTHTRLLGVDAAARVARVADAHTHYEVSYRVLIAADGPHSPTAAHLGLPALDVVNTRQYTVPLLQRPYRDTDFWLSDEFPGGYAWLFPKGPLANIGLGADTRLAGDMKQPLARLHAALVERGVVGAEIIARTGGAIPVGGLRARLVERDVLFVGDAAGLTHPITGAGIAAAVVSGERAGVAAAAFIAGDVHAFSDFEEDVRDQFEDSITRALARRRELAGYWRTPAASSDRAMRRGWIAFPEYFAN